MATTRHAFFVLNYKKPFEFTALFVVVKQRIKRGGTEVYSCIKSGT